MSKPVHMRIPLAHSGFASLLVVLVAGPIFLAGSYVIAPCGAVIPSGPPVAVISSPENNATFNADETILFDGSGSYDPGGRIVSWFWDFGTGHDPDAGQTVNTSFRKGGHYLVWLNVTDDENQKGSASIEINIRYPPVAVITSPEHDSSCPVNATVHLVSGSYDPDGRIASWEWDFGDGTNATGAGDDLNVSHVYSSMGHYTIWLTVVDEKGMSDRDLCILKITDAKGNFPPIARIQSPRNNASFAPNVSITFDASLSRDFDGQIVEWSWTVEPASSPQSGQIVKYRFEQEGRYLITLKVVDNGSLEATDNVTINIRAGANHPPVAVISAPQNGSVFVANRMINFEGSQSYDPDGNISMWVWDFGDGHQTWGGTSNITARHSYNRSGQFTVTLSVQDENGSYGIESLQLFVGGSHPPVAIISSPANASAFGTDVPISFDGSQSYDINGTVMSWLWDFGDRSAPGCASAYTHSYAVEGLYKVTLTIHDDSGMSDEAAIFVNITNSSGPATYNIAPVAIISSPENGTTFFTQSQIEFNGKTSFDPDGNITAWLWDFGDGGTDGSTSVCNRQYAQAGQYEVTLRVCDNGSKWGQAKVHFLIVNGSGPGPGESLAIRLSGGDNASGTHFWQEESIRFSLVTNKSGLSNYYWSFGDGSNASGPNPVHAFGKPGTYQVILQVWEGPRLFYVAANVTIDSRQMPTASSPATLSPAWGIIVPASIILVAVVASAIFLGGTETGLYSLLGLLFLLYTKIRREEVLDNIIRGKIIGYVIANPGDHYNAIRDALDLNNGTLAWHLNRLEQENIVKSRTDGIYKRFYPFETRIPEPDKEALTEVQRMILAKVAETPGLSQKDIAGLLNVSSPTVSYHIEHLLEKGRVRRERSGIRVRYFPAALVIGDGERTLRNG